MEYRTSKRVIPSGEDYEILGRMDLFDSREGRRVIPAYDNNIMGGRVLRPLIKNERE